VNVRVTDSAVMNLNSDVFRTKSATLELHELVGTSRRITRHTFSGIGAIAERS
jgi:hypothetical protein